MVKFKLNISPGTIVFVLGFGGLVICLADGSEQIGGKVPLSLFFLFIITLGVIIEMKSKDKNSDVFGEMDNGGFG